MVEGQLLQESTPVNLLSSDEQGGSNRDIGTDNEIAANISNDLAGYIRFPKC
jgi:hypothetical protein